MNNKNNNTISNFLVEIIIVILFFSIASVIIVKIFATSSYNNELNKLRTNAIINANSLIEVYKSDITLKDTIYEVFDMEYDIKESENGYEILLNDSMEYKKNGKVLLKIVENEDVMQAGICKNISLKYIYNRRELYVIEGKKYEKK